MSTAIAIFVKTPKLSPIKTRLAAAIGTAEAIRFHRLACAATAQVVGACRPGLAPYWAVAEEPALTAAAWTGFPRLWQGTGTLGERLHRIHAELHARHRAVLMIGADTPQLTPALLRRSLAALQNPVNTYVLGPASDGGFWLFGSKNPIPATLWNGVAYSRHDTAETLRRALQGTGRLALLPTLTDIDTADDLRGLQNTLESLSERVSAQNELIRWLTRLSAFAAVSAERISAAES